MKAKAKAAGPVAACDCKWEGDRAVYICSGHGGCAARTATRRPLVGDSVEAFREDGTIAVGVVVRIGWKYLHLLVCRPSLRVVKYPRTWIRRTIVATKAGRLRRIRALAVTGKRYGATPAAVRALTTARRAARAIADAGTWDTETTTAELARREQARK